MANSNCKKAKAITVSRYINKRWRLRGSKGSTPKERSICLKMQPGSRKPLSSLIKSWQSRITWTSCKLNSLSRSTQARDSLKNSICRWAPQRFTFLRWTSKLQIHSVKRLILQKSQILQTLMLREQDYFSTKRKSSYNRARTKDSYRKIKPSIVACSPVIWSWSPVKNAILLSPVGTRSDPPQRHGCSKQCQCLTRTYLKGLNLAINCTGRW